MLKGLKLSHYSHTGRLKPHEHTSYLSLGIILLIVGLALTSYTVFAATPYDGPESSSISLTGAMPGKAPTVAATIDVPSGQQRFSATPISVSGTCPAKTLVEVFKNDIFSGSTPCNDIGTYSLESDLLYGENKLVAKVYDSLNQPGPDSNIVTVHYDVLPAQAGAIKSLDFGNAQLILNTQAVFRGAFPGKAMQVPISVIGGTPPYAINIQWGDSTNKVVPQNNNEGFTTEHIYTKAGTYQVSLQASDATGRVAFLTFATIVNGQPNTDTGSISSTSTTNNLLVLWPLYTSAAAVVVSFFIGEKREKRILQLRGMIASTQS